MSVIDICSEAETDPQNPVHFRDNWPYFWVARTSAYYTQALEKRLKPLGVDAPRWRVLISLYEQRHMSVSEIADFSTLKLNTATKIVQRMLADDLVKTRVRPTDGRVTEVCLTEKGDALRAQALAEVLHIRDESFAQITEAEAEALNSILSKITAELSMMI